MREKNPGTGRGKVAQVRAEKKRVENNTYRYGLYSLEKKGGRRMISANLRLGKKRGS